MSIVSYDIVYGAYFLPGKSDTCVPRVLHVTAFSQFQGYVAADQAGAEMCDAYA